MHFVDAFIQSVFQAIHFNQYVCFLVLNPWPFALSYTGTVDVMMPKKCGVVFCLYTSSKTTWCIFIRLSLSLILFFIHSSKKPNAHFTSSIHDLFENEWQMSVNSCAMSAYRLWDPQRVSGSTDVMLWEMFANEMHTHKERDGSSGYGRYETSSWIFVARIQYQKMDISNIFNLWSHRDVSGH